MRIAKSVRVWMLGLVCLLSWTAYGQEAEIHKDYTAAVPPTEESAELSFSLAACFNSTYIWRGQLLNDDFVFQPSIGLAYGGLSASLWGNMDMTDYHDNSGEFTEYDWTVGYADTIPGMDFLKYSVGVIYYYFPSISNDADTVEIYAGLGLDMPLSPTVTVYRDVDEIDGTYVAFSVSHSIDTLFELSPEMPVGMTFLTSLGWGSQSYNKGYWGGLDESSLQDLTVTVGFPIAVSGWTLTPTVNYVTLLDSDVRRADTYATGSHNNDSDYFFTGITLSTGF
jgi:hypothetical protein